MSLVGQTFHRPCGVPMRGVPSGITYYMNILKIQRCFPSSMPCYHGHWCPLAVWCMYSTIHWWQLHHYLGISQFALTLIAELEEKRRLFIIAKCAKVHHPRSKVALLPARLPLPYL